MMLLCLFLAGCGSPAQHGGTRIPGIANFGGVQIGVSTQEDVARRWGEGRVVIGGHPKSGRVWRLRGVPWLLRSDGFEYSTRGLVVDSVTLEHADAVEPNTPYAKLPADQFPWLGGIRLGNSQEEVLSALKRGSLTVIPDPPSFRVEAKGDCAHVTAHFTLWTANLEFQDGILVRLSLDVSEGR